MGQTSFADMPSHAPRSVLPSIPAGAIIAGLAAWLGIGQMLLWRFLDCAPSWLYPISAIILALLCIGIYRAMPRTDGPSIPIIILCMATALILLILGGEGRFFYANIDWQVRAAVMRDMGVNPWPFVYTARDTPDVLRAPIGMFLAPALAFKMWGPRAADLALLIQNSLMLGALLSLGSMLFSTRHARLIALTVVLAFSGLDALGRILFRAGLSDHLENWAFLQYSSTVTLAFWVPQHALSGWIGAIGFMLWRAGKFSLGGFLALLPMTAIWSPLGLIGAIPFAALAGLETLWQRKLRVIDMALPALSTLLSFCSLLYLGAANDAVGLRYQPLPFTQWAIFEILEVLVYLVPLLLIFRKDRSIMVTLLLCGAWLLVIPYVQVGSSIDFMMRGSITALTIIAVLVAKALTSHARGRPWLITMLVIGSITGGFEIARAFHHPPMPQVRCTFFKAWEQSFWFQPKDTYLAPLARMPSAIRPEHPSFISAAEPNRCWTGNWYRPEEAAPAHPSARDKTT